MATGTDPLNPDTDGDGIEDGDEVYGTLGGLDLPGMGTSPVHKDIFLECDWLTDDAGNPDKNKPHENQIARVVAAFASAPITNPDGVTGVTLHSDVGQPPYGGGNYAGVDPLLDVVGFLDGEFQTVKSGNFAGNRLGYFHYMISCDQYSNSGVPSNSSGLAEYPGNDFIVSLGQTWTGDVDAIGNTILHELGHNLYLHHGGFEERNYKPNYNSVMNYRYQFDGADADCDSFGDSIADFSYGMLAALNEQQLNETQGICGSPGIDWDGGGLQINVAQNINCAAGITTACGNSHPNCYDTSCNLLQDYDDWANIVLDPAGDLDAFFPELIACQEVPAVP